jgi:hypothetical protein
VDPGDVLGEWQQADRDPGPILGPIGILSVALVMAGFFVYAGRTGSWTVMPGSLSALGALLWFGPLAAWAALYLIGPRGPLDVLWKTPSTVVFSAVGLSVRDAASREVVLWTSVGSATTTAWAPSSRAGVVLRDLHGHAIGRLPGIVTRPGAGRRWLIDLILAAQPDRFEGSGGWWRGARLRKAAA